MKTVDKYMDHLYTYLLALAIAGAQKSPGAPTVQEVVGAESTDYVQVPLDLLHSYFWRARRASQYVPEYNRLAWIERLDTEAFGCRIFATAL